MLKTYSETKLIRTSNCDFTGHWRPSDILAMMQELAGTHAHLLGCGREPMLEKGIVWVLSSTELHMDRYPAVAETVRMETFPMENKRWFFPRYFRMYGQDGQEIGRAATLWLLMDVVERKIAAPDAALAFLPDNSDMEAPLPFPKNVAQITGTVQELAYKPVNMDIDVNGHVNNTRYADILANALPMETLRDNEFAEIVLRYQREVLPRQALELSLTIQEDGEGSLRMIGSCEGERSLRMIGSCEGERFFDIGARMRGRG